MSIRGEVSKSLRLLPAADVRRYRMAVSAQILLALMDLAGVLLIGLVGLLAASLAGGSALPQGLQSVLDALGMGSWSAASAAAALGAAAAVTLAVKSGLSLLIQRRMVLFLASRVSQVGSAMVVRFLSQSILDVQRRPATWVTFAFVEGLTYAISGVLGHFLVIAGDLAVLVLLGTALLFFDPVTTAVTVTYFGIVIWLLSSRLGRWATGINRSMASSNIGSRDAIQDAMSTFREAVVAGRRDYFRAQFSEQRAVYAKTMADNSTLTAVPRYTMEIALVGGSVVLVVTLLLTGGSLTDAVGGLALFLAAVTRITPSLLRLNGAFLGIRASAASAERTMELFDEIRDVPPCVPPLQMPREQDWGPASVVIRDVSVRYPQRDDWALRDITLELRPGQSLALVGPTGAGKSSLADVVLGVIAPTSGSVRIDGSSAEELVARRPGALAYVPQSVAIVHGTVLRNVALGLVEADHERVWAALDRAHLGDFVRSLPDGLDTIVGERGVRISGGQRQRLGLARALYTTPALLVLDEATSSLDAETERAIADTIGSLGSLVTTITVAHRLATIRSADVVAYLQDGGLIAVGSFDHVRETVPSFERQARLLGL